VDVALRLRTAILPRVRLSRFAGGIVLVGSGSILGQVALALAAPVLARLYDPAAFGLLSVYAAFLSILVAGASLRFDLAIPVATDDRQAVHLVVLSIGLGLAASVLLAIGTVLWGGTIAAELGVAPLVPFLWLLPIALFAASAVQALGSWAVYLREFGSLGRMRATQAIGQVACQVGLGLVGAGPLGLILGDVVGRVAGVERLVRGFTAALKAAPVTRAAITHDARATWGFARVMTAASLLNVLSAQIPFLLIPALFDLDSSGQFFIAYRLLILPASLVAAAVSQVFFGEAAFRRSDPMQLRQLARRMTVTLLVFAIPTYAVLTVVGSVLVETVFGSRWETAGLMAQILAPSMILWSVASPISTLLVVGRRQRESLAFTGFELMVGTGSLVIGALVHSLIVGIVLMSLTSIPLDIGGLWRFLRVASMPVTELARPAGRIGLIVLPLVVILLLCLSLPAVVILSIAVLGGMGVIGIAASTSPDVRELLAASHD
jgi:O-antigen/teichoic acid export membrane protein